MRESKDGKTVGITLRLDRLVLQEYSRIASRANLIEIKKGRPGGYTAQDIMRHRLNSLPSVKRQLGKEGVNEKTSGDDD